MAYQVAIENDRGPLVLETVDHERDLKRAMARLVEEIAEIIATDRFTIKEVADAS